MVNPAFPAISADFALEVAQIQWVPIADLLAYGSLALISGRLGDLYGYRRICLLGLAVRRPPSPRARWRRPTPGFSPHAFCRAWDRAHAGRRAAPGDGSVSRVAPHGGARALFGGAGARPCALSGGWRDADRGVRLARRVRRARADRAGGARAARARSGSAAASPCAGFRRCRRRAAHVLAHRVRARARLAGRGRPGRSRCCGGRRAGDVHRAPKRARPLARHRPPAALFLDARFALFNTASVGVHFVGFAMFLLGPYFFVRVAGGSTPRGGSASYPSGRQGAALGAALAERLVRRFGTGRVAFASASLVAVSVGAAAAWNAQSAVIGIGLLLFAQGAGIGLFRSRTPTTWWRRCRSPSGAWRRASPTSRARWAFSRRPACSRRSSAPWKRTRSPRADAQGAFLAGYRVSVACAAAALGLFLAATLVRPRLWTAR